METVGDSISRVRNILKVVKDDAFITDRFIYSLIMKYGKTLIYRDKRAANIFKNSGLFRELPYVELMDVDAIDANCAGISNGCTFKRSVHKLPKIMQLDNGPVIRAVTTIDYSQQLNKTEPSLYVNATKSSGFKYNKTMYYWVMDGYLFIPKVDWEAVRIQALFEEEISSYFCSPGNKTCGLEQDRLISIPEHLFSEIENNIRQEFGIMLQTPGDGADDQLNQFN